MSEYVVDVPDGMSITHASDGTYPTCCRELTMRGEVVRCRDCAHRYEHTDARGTKFLCDRQLYDEVTLDGFCAWGERRGDAQV